MHPLPVHVLFSFSDVPPLCAAHSFLGLVGGAVLLGGTLTGCDQVSRRPSAEPPRVTNVQVVPDSVRAGNLPPDLVQDSLAQVPLQVSARAADPDAAIERVVFTFDPATDPGAAAVGQLQATEGDLYVREVAVTVPADRDEVFTIEVFAVDTDSLASNRVTGQFRFISPEGTP